MALLLISAQLPLIILVTYTTDDTPVCWPNSTVASKMSECWNNDY